jgi:hypothetical protein
MHGQPWNIGPMHGSQWTVLDEVPPTTDLMFYQKSTVSGDMTASHAPGPGSSESPAVGDHTGPAGSHAGPGWTGFAAWSRSGEIKDVLTGDIGMGRMRT